MYVCVSSCHSTTHVSTASVVIFMALHYLRTLCCNYIVPQLWHALLIVCSLITPLVAALLQLSLGYQGFFVSTGMYMFWCHHRYVFQ